MPHTEPLFPPADRHRPKRVLPTLLLILASIPLPAFASSWWNHDWSYRKSVVLDTSAQGANVSVDVSDVPMLIRLHDGNFKFSDAAADGADIRIVADDDKTPLKFHIESFDSVFNLGFIWVQLPLAKANAQTHLWIYYGNAKAVTASDSHETYGGDEALVYHFSSHGTPVGDATANANNSTSTIAIEDGGLIGPAARFDGQHTVDVPLSSSLQINSGGSATWSMWIKPAAADADAVLYARHDSVRGIAIGLQKGRPYVSITDDAGTSHPVVAEVAVDEKTWHSIAVTANGSALSLYVDGHPAGTAAVALPELNGPASIGGDGTSPAAPHFTGAMDEFDIAKIARAPAFLQFSTINQGTDDRLVSEGVDEQLSSWSSGYFGVILHSVTFDGWAIISVLMVMAVISWIVMFQKAVQVGRTAHANTVFLKIYRAVAADFGSLMPAVTGTGSLPGLKLTPPERRTAQTSPLFHLFSTGVEELRGRIGSEHRNQSTPGTYLSAQSIEAIRATLDSNLVRETQSLNKLMVLLTIAISGGPFLGLLGTVVGVMITFAAIAASGDVNVNAIAPGIAAALVATVAGLAVAIPALFGYNYLISRIKDVSVEMQVFLDAFVTRMAEAYDTPADLRAMTSK